MRETVRSAWDLLSVAYKQNIGNDSNFTFDESLFDKCYSQFQYWHKTIQKYYMKDSKKELDRHKIAAILTISIIESKAICCKTALPDDQIFIGSQLLAVTCGLSYMQDQLNQILIENNYRTIDKFDLPTPLSCDTDYLEVLARNLYFQEYGKDSDGKKIWSLNPLSLANEYFLIEYMTLLNRHIPIDTFLKEQTCNS